MPLSHNWNIARNHGRFLTASESETVIKLHAITTSIIHEIIFGRVTFSCMINYLALAIWE